MANYNKSKKRSFVAAVISFLGSLVLVYGLYLVLSELFIIFTSDDGGAGRIILGILVLVLSAIIQYASILYDRFREYKKWVKRLKNSGIEEELAQNDELARRAYLSNPTPLGLRYIEERNPKVASEIKAHLENGKRGFSDKLYQKIYDKYDSDVKIRTKDEKESSVIPTAAEQDWENGETIIR